MYPFGWWNPQGILFYLKATCFSDFMYKIQVSPILRYLIASPHKLKGEHIYQNDLKVRTSLQSPKVTTCCQGENLAPVELPCATRDLKIRGRRRQRKRRRKSEFAFFQSSSRLLQVTNFVKCRWTLLSWIPKAHIQVQEERGNFVFACVLPL